MNIITEDDLVAEFGDAEVGRARHRLIATEARVSVGEDALARDRAHRLAKQHRRWRAFDRLVEMKARNNHVATFLLGKHFPTTAFRTCSCMRYGCEVREEIAGALGIRALDNITY